MLVFTVIGVLAVLFVATAMLTGYLRAIRERRAAAEAFWLEPKQRHLFHRVLAEFVTAVGARTQWPHKIMIAATVSRIEEENANHVLCMSKADRWLHMADAWDDLASMTNSLSPDLAAMGMGGDWDPEFGAAVRRVFLRIAGREPAAA